MPGSIKINSFSKSYGDILAVNNISLAIDPGELVGLIGPDGAGKTTTMRTLCTLLVPDAGEVLVDGRDVRTNVAAIRAMLGYMPQRFSLYPDLTVAQNLNFFADLFGVPPAEKAERLQTLYQFSKLEPFRKRLAGALSGGMKQKLALSCTLIHTPRTLILDEPTTGVDPVSRREFWNILRQLRDEGVTILVSTPYMEEADLCDRVAFMYQGRILAVDKPAQLVHRFPYKLYEVSGSDLQSLRAYLEDETDALSVQIFGDRLHVSYGPESALIAPAGAESVQQIEPSIEDVFLYLMQTSA